MNILAIGNSFSQDATRYLHQIARADGKDLQITNLYIGGCPLDRHYRNMLADSADYVLQYNGQVTGFFVSIKQALLNREWDVITLQQASPRSPFAESYFPYINALYDYVKKHAPKAKIVIHQTWAYEQGCPKLEALGFADSTRNHCECENCRKLNPADFQIMIANELDEELIRRGDTTTKIALSTYVDMMFPEVQVQ